LELDVRRELDRASGRTLTHTDGKLPVANPSTRSGGLVPQFLKKSIYESKKLRKFKFNFLKPLYQNQDFKSFVGLDDYLIN
jgi:hypothetical protein